MSFGLCQYRVQVKTFELVFPLHSIPPSCGLDPTTNLGWNINTCRHRLSPVEKASSSSQKKKRTVVWMPSPETHISSLLCAMMKRNVVKRWVLLFFAIQEFGTLLFALPVTRKKGTRRKATPSLVPENNSIRSILSTDFGAPGGTPIGNKDSVFREIDRALGVSKPPDIEILLAEHLICTANPLSFFLHRNLMRFGHLAIRYTTSDGVSRVMNILGDFDKDPEATMVNIFTPEEYIFGTLGFDSYAQQGGVYNRPFVGLRIENVAPGTTDALHAYYLALAKTSAIGEGDKKGEKLGFTNQGAARFQLVEVNLSKLARTLPSPLDRLLYKVSDWFRSVDEARRVSKEEKSKKCDTTPQARSNMSLRLESSVQQVQETVQNARSTIYNSGNCAQFASAGLEFVGLIRRTRQFPKAVLVELLEEETLTYKRRDNVHIVYYAEVDHAVKAFPDYKCLEGTLVHPLRPIRNIFYKNMRDFASAKVVVPSGGEQAVVTTQAPPKKPGRWLQVITGLFLYVPAAIMTGLVGSVGPLGPTAAALWLLANWWLY